MIKDSTADNKRFQPQGGIKKRKKRKSLAGRFFKTLFLIVFAFVLFSSAAIFAYSKIVGFKDTNPKQGSQMNIIDALIGKDISLNIAVFGVDEDETRTDVIVVFHFDSKSGNLGMFSVPRDTRVKISDEMYTYLKSNNKYIPSGGICKINEVHAYAGKEKANHFSIVQLEELLGIEIDHYVKVNFDGFTNLVDAIGGVEFYVPQDMKWDMRDTGDIYINLKEGLQPLDGEKAQQLVRFRRYPLGDEQRVAVQQDFLKALMNKLLSSETMIKSFPALIKTAYDYVETDINITDAVKYAQYAKDVDLSKLKAETLPGAGEYVGNISYFLYDEAAVKPAVSKIFFSDNIVDGKDSKDKVIEVANGGSKGGFAGKNQDMLVKEGYNVAKTSNFEGEKTEYTRIVVKEKGAGEDLKVYYPNSKIILDKSMLEEGIDILIILGTKE